MLGECIYGAIFRDLSSLECLRAPCRTDRQGEVPGVGGKAEDAVNSLVNGDAVARADPHAAGGVTGQVNGVIFPLMRRFQPLRPFGEHHVLPYEKDAPLDRSAS